MGEQSPAHYINKYKEMEKKFYEMPEVEVVELQLEGALLDGSIDGDAEKILDGEGDGNDLG